MDPILSSTSTVAINLNTDVEPYLKMVRSIGTYHKIINQNYNNEKK